MRRLTFSLDNRHDRNRSTSLPQPNAPAQASRADRPQCYSTHVPAALLDQQSDLIEQLMGFAHALGARRLEVYVRDDE